jgi:hypothetical protein
VNPEIRALQPAMEREGYIADAAHRHRALPRRRPAQAAPRRGRRRRRQDRDRQGPGALRAPSSSACSATRGSTSPTAVYEWNYPRQMLRVRSAERRGPRRRASRTTIFSATTSSSGRSCAR